MILHQFPELLAFGLPTAAAALFLFLTLAMEADYLPFGSQPVAAALPERQIG
jgi:hypothetical protein